MRTIVTIVAIILYCFSYEQFIKHAPEIPVIHGRVWVNGTFGAFAFLLYLDTKYLTDCKYHKEFNLIAAYTYCLNFLLITGYYFFDGTTGTEKIIIFNALVGTISLLILGSGLWHGLFKPNEK